MWKLGSILFLLLFVMGACHKTYDDWMNNTDVLGPGAIAMTILSATLFLLMNQRKVNTICGHTNGDAAMCLQGNCTNGWLNVGEIVTGLAFLASLGAGGAYLSDPGWLTTHPSGFH